MVNVYGKPVEWWKGIMVNGVLKENWNLYSKILLYRASFHYSTDNWNFCYSYSRAFTIPLQTSKPGKNKQALFLIAFIKLVDRIELKNTLSPSKKSPSCGLKTVCILSKYGPREPTLMVWTACSFRNRHKVAIKRGHSTLSWAFACTSPHLRPYYFSSFITFLRQVVLTIKRIETFFWC